MKYLNKTMVKDVDDLKEAGKPPEEEKKDLEREDKSSESPPSTPASAMSSKQIQIQQQIERELGLARFLDYVVNEPFELIYQSALMDKYQSQLIEPIFGDQTKEHELDGKHIQLKEDFTQLEIEKKYKSLIKKSEKIAEKEAGLKAPYLNKIKKLSLSIISVTFVALLIGMAVDNTGTIQSLYIPIALVLCFFPRLLQKIYLNKWTELKKELEKKLIEERKDELDDVKMFIQYILTDVRERLLENHLPLQVINFMLLSQDYENVKIVTTQNMRSRQHYILQFEYPEGMQPFEIPKQLVEKMGTTGSNQVGTDDENDDFVILQNPKFDEEGAIISYELVYPKPITIEGIEQLLDSVEFISVDKPELVIPNYTNNTEIKCRCGEPIRFSALKTAVSDITGERFEFYFGIGKKCKCGKNPFVLFTSPGNEKTPTELEDIFGQVKFED